MRTKSARPVLLIVSRSMPPDVGGYQRQFTLVCPHLRERFERIVWVGAVRDEPTSPLKPIPGVDRVVRLRVWSAPAVLRSLAALGVVSVAAAMALAMRVVRRPVRVLLLSPSMRGAPYFVRLVRALGYDVVARYPTSGDLTDRRGKAVGRTRGVVAIAPSPLQQVEQDQFPVHLVANSVEPVGVAPVSHDRHRFIYVGRLVRRKRADLLVDAWRKIAERLPEWELVLVGDGGSEPDSIEKELREAVATGSVPRLRFAGRLADAGPELRAAHVFVFPSVREGQPNSVLEALASGVPVIADPRRAAEWFDPVPPLLDWTGEDADLAPAMVRAAERSDREAAGARSREFVREHHAPARTARMLALALQVG